VENKGSAKSARSGVGLCTCHHWSAHRGDAIWHLEEDEADGKRAPLTGNPEPFRPCATGMVDLRPSGSAPAMPNIVPSKCLSSPAHGGTLGEPQLPDRAEANRAGFVIAMSQLYIPIFFKQLGQ
jgi:hypothetical protein